MIVNVCVLYICVCTHECVWRDTLRDLTCAPVYTVTTTDFSNNMFEILDNLKECNTYVFMEKNECVCVCTCVCVCVCTRACVWIEGYVVRDLTCAPVHTNLSVHDTTEVN